MCGIVASYRRSGGDAASAVTIAMRDELHHRGPDDEGIWSGDGVALGHRRLSIVDLSTAGHQPMSNEDGTVWLVFNGEIYNYVELAERLRARGHRFQSHTDTEVIVHLYEDEGEHCVRHLNGMFAFVIWDQRKQTLFAARDRLGIKPLHYYVDGDWFLCASEIKALLAHPRVRPEVDNRGLADFFFAGHTLSTKTMFSGIQQLAPGHCLTASRGTLRTWEYWAPVYRYEWNRSDGQVVADLSDLLDDAVRLHCRSDATLGSHLSGGMDSSLVTALAAKHRGHLKSFSIRFNDIPYFDESAYARDASRHVGTTHFEDSPGPDDLVGNYALRMWHQESPMPNAAGFTYYSASRLAARHVKVALTGHGGDEIFGGYPAQFQTAFGSTAMFDASAQPKDIQLTRVMQLRRMLRQEGFRGVLSRVGRRLRREKRSLGFADLWLSLHCGAEPATNPALHRSFRAALAGYTPRPEYLAPLEQAPTDQTFDRLLHHDLRVFLPSLLNHEDRASMAVSLESRVPLLDYRIIEYLATVPPEQKVRGMVPKGLLRAVARPLLPGSIVDRRDKVPFASPERVWLHAGQLAAMNVVLSEERTLDRGIFAPDDLRKGQLEPHAQFAVFNTELWFRLFIDRDPQWLDRARPRANQAAPDPRWRAGSSYAPSTA